MPRSSRIAVAHYPHHIVQRGHNRQDVFANDGDRLSYLATLLEYRQKLGLKVYAYCLMTNHVHLVIDPGGDSANLSLLMKRLAGRHTRRINRRECRTGSCWDGRFKCSPIESDRYLLACMRYVDLNPVRAMLVRRPEEYRWSSYRARAGLRTCDWLDEDPCLLALGVTPDLQQSRYRQFVEAGITSDEVAFIRNAVRSNRHTGCKAFVAEMQHRTGLRIPHRARGRPAMPK